MQFKEVGKRIQVIKYAGYDNEKKRAITKMVGSLCRYVYTPSNGLLESLTDEEKEELQSFINDKQQSDEKKYDSSVLKGSHSHIKRIADCILKEESDSQSINVSAIWESITELQKALKKKGLVKPKTTSKAKKPDPRQTSFPIEGDS